jgi:peptidoglycan/LPS O-acetylase OafA/YrhL
MQPNFSGEEHNNNNFDFLRFFAALVVILSHSFTYCGNIRLDPIHALTGAWTLGTIGVFIFFIISGYLITKSWVTKPITRKFFWNRILRIVPGMILICLFTILIVGPINTNISIVDYFTNSQTWDYLLIITIIPLYAKDVLSLPGVFTTNPFPNVINGSLWTIPYEFTMYFSVYLLGIVGIVKKRLFLPIILLFLFIIYLMFSLRMLKDVEYGILSNLALLGIQFFIGAFFYLFRDQIKLDNKMAIAALFIWILSLGAPKIIFIVLSFILIPYIVFTFAQLPIKRLNNFGKWGDFSYGMYIFAYPLQQTLIHLIGVINPIVFFALSFICIFPFSVMSWHLVESRALKLKRYDPVQVFKAVYQTVWAKKA